MSDAIFYSTRKQNVHRTAYRARIRWVLMIAVLLVMSGRAHGQSAASLVGTVTGTQGGVPIEGAHVTIFETGSDHALTATATDAAGRYRMSGFASGVYRMEVDASGYRTARHRTTLRAGRTETLRIALHATAPEPEAGVTTPSRRSEAARHAPVFVTVVQPEVRCQAVPSSGVDLLRSVAGVNLARTGLDRHQIALRGFNNVFAGDPLVLVDDRPAGLPALGANVFALMPIQPVDLKRVEVVRGPAAALYGPAAADGVIHFITKDPFEDPGTTVDVTGGQRQFVRGQFRHADDIGGTFGYEITAHAARGTDWQLDPAHPADRPWLARDYVFDDIDNRRTNQLVDLETGQLLRDPDYWKAGIRGRFAYRLGRQTTIAAQGGYASLTGRLLSEMGALQASYLGYSFGQVRVESGGLFAQVMLNNNEAGASYIYGTGQPFVDRGVAYGAQLRYRFDVPHWATAFTVGADARWTRPRTKGTLMGRHEARDAVDRYGVYGSASTEITTRLDAALALRADVDNLSATVWPAARAALMYDVAPAHMMRLRYERAVAAPEARTHFLDMNARRHTLEAPYDFVHRVQGAADGFTFRRYRDEGRATSLIPGTERFGRPLRVSAIPLQALYETTAVRFDQVLTDPATRPGPVEQLSASQTLQLASTLRELINGFEPQDHTAGVLGVPHGGNGYRPVGPPEDVTPLARPIAQMLEVGYHGQVGRLEVAADVYVRSEKNAIRPAEMVTPLVYAAQLEQDLAATLTPLITQAANDPGAALRGLLDAMDITPDAAARLTAALVGQEYAGMPVGVIQPDQAVLPSDASTAELGALITYRNADRVRSVGADVRIQANVHDRVDALGALSIMHPSRFGDGSRAPNFMLNAPRLTAHVGGEVGLAEAWTIHAAAHYKSGFPVRAGVYTGTVATAYPLDIGLHYDATRYAPGLEVHLTVQNVLNQQRRAFAGTPALGRMARARITYAL